MKTLLKHETKIQEFLVGLFLITIIVSIIIQNDFTFPFLIAEFFLIAIFQYIINFVKFFNHQYKNSSMRKFYFYAASYGVAAFVVLLTFLWLDLDLNGSILGICVGSLIILSPILIILSVLISYPKASILNQMKNLLFKIIMFFLFRNNKRTRADFLNL